MKCKLHKETLMQASNRIIAFINRKPVTPILGTYLLSFSNNHLELSAHEGDHQAITSCDANCQSELKICVPAYQFHKIIESFIDPEILLSLKGTGANGSMQKLVIKSGKSRHELPIFDALLFPQVKKPEGYHVVKVDAASILAMWENISKLIDEKNSTTPQMTGINHLTHDLAPGNLVLCGGTTFRSAIATYPTEIGSWKPIIIHFNVVSRAREMFTDGIRTLTIAHDGSRCIITDGINSILTRGLEGKFPDITKLVKNFTATNKNNVTFNCGEVLDGLKRLMFHKSETVETLQMNITNKTLELNFVNRDIGTEGNEEIYISGNPSEAILGMNILMLNDCLKCCNSQSADFHYHNAFTAYIINPVDQIAREYSMTILLAPTSL